MNIDKMLEQNMRMRKIKEELEGSDNVSFISDTVDSLTEDEAKILLRLFIYSR